jgi:uracil-DNA glycosylase family 4
MACSQRVLDGSIGPLSAKLMFVGEAPGRLGADASGIPFHGDTAGVNFESLLEGAGLSRYDCLVTNAVLCNPKDERGNNATPKPIEVRNCSVNLRQQIEIFQPSIVVSLGGTALKALAFVEEHSLALDTHVRTSNRWFNRSLIPLYHPGQRAMIHRSYANQRSDYRFIAEEFRRVQRGGLRRPTGGKSSEVAADLVRRILKINGPTEYFAIHKLMYLAEVRSTREGAGRLWDGYIVRQKDGPYYTDFNIQRLKKAVPELRISKRENRLLLSTPNGQTDLFSQTKTEGEDFLAEIVRDFGELTNAQLKTKSYLTSPMKRILRVESDTGIGRYNCPISFE